MQFAYLDEVSNATNVFSGGLMHTVYLVVLHAIRPNERYDEAHAYALATQIERMQVWTTPIALERHTLAVMDGHHRLAAAKYLGLTYIPCLLLDYSLVSVEASRAHFRVDPDEIIRRAVQYDLYPPKTTRHIFPAISFECCVSLIHLRHATYETACHNRSYVEG